MRTDIAQPIRLADYRPTDYLIDTVDLDVKLDPHATRVVARLAIRPNPKGHAGADLVLDGDGLNAKRIVLDGKSLDIAGNFVTPDRLTIAQPPQQPFTLEVETELDPAANTYLMGLYRSGSAYCTQCEAEGFRRITYFLDRPDVLSVYTTRLEAEIAEAPVLLGNGNPVSSRQGRGNQPPFRRLARSLPKALLSLRRSSAAISASIRDEFTTASGRKVALAIYVEHGKEDARRLCDGCAEARHALGRGSLGREYDLDVFNIVAVSDFNMGAMENKGLNIFNDKYVLASPETATDDGLRAVSRRSSRTNISIIGPATASPAATGSSSA